MNKVRLFLGDSEVQFKTEPEIFYNYTETDLQNPTIVKNSYSKTISIEGTPENNRIFGQFWDMSRNQTVSSFNPSQKTPFRLYFNGEICESGYAKLDEVIRNGERITYSITLYGGLGEFFYILSFNENGDKLKLSDLEYTTSGGDDEFNFTINKETVNEAWNSLSATTGTKWDIINFAPCYNGSPDGLSADKVLINFKNNILVSATTSGSTQYTYRQGYSLGTLPSDVDEWVTRDLRSWNQRPVIKMGNIIKACERYASKEGYSVDYDASFFNSENPYWTDTWMTLPKMDEIKIQGENETPSYVFTPTLVSVTTLQDWYHTIYKIGTGNIPLGTERIDINMVPVLNVSDYSRSRYLPISGDTLYSSTYADGKKNFNGFLIQLLGYDGSDYNSNIVAASDAVFITSKVGDEYLNISNQNINLDSYIALNKNYTNVFGNFIPMGGGNYQFTSEISLSLENSSKAESYALMVSCIANTEQITTSGGETYYVMGKRRGNFYNSQSIMEVVKSGASINTIELRTSRNNFVRQASGTTYAGTDTAGYSGAKITKKALLDTEATPADYLLSFTKMFGLYFTKNPYDKVIHIMTRNSFYRTGTTIDVNDRIDRGSDNVITPIAFDSKWYLMQFENVEGSAAEKYSTTYGNAYGVQRINTGYNFDNNSTDLYKDSAFKGAVECTEKGRYYIAPVDYDGYFDIPYYYYQGMSYQLYNGTGNTIDLYATPIPVESEPMKLRKYYDAFSKAQFRDSDYKPIDGQNVLLFFNGIIENKNESNKTIPYFITDDLPIMGLLNDGQACWISTESIYNVGGTQIAIERDAIPEFGRYKQNNGYILNSLDFGNPKELFIPDAVLRENSSIYANYWQKYITDLYDVNTRIYECQVLLDDKPSSDLLRNFYWFDNSVWRINKITDWRIGTNETTKVQLIKVEDKDNYTLEPVKRIGELTLSASTLEIPFTGGSVTFTVTSSDGGSWTGTDAWGDNIPSGTGDTTFTHNFSTPPSGISRELILSVIGEQGQYSNTVTLHQYNNDITISPTLLEAGYSGKSGVITVTSISPVDWTCSSDSDWITVTKSNGNVEYVIGENTGTSYRNGTITVTNGYSTQTCRVQQGTAILKLAARNNLCISCGACMGTLESICPVGCWLTLDDGVEVHSNDCIACGDCLNPLNTVCPIGNDNMFYLAPVNP